VNVFPYAHCEIVLLFRYQMYANDTQPAATLGMLQLHYYL